MSIFDVALESFIDMNHELVLLSADFGDDHPGISAITTHLS